MHDRTPLHSPLPLRGAFVDLEDRLFGWEGDTAGARSDGFVSGALGRRRRVRMKTDRYPTVPLGPELARKYAMRELPTLEQLQGR